MPERLTFDDRLWNKYAVENLEESHPALYDRLKVWFKGIADLDDTSLAKLIAARGPEVEKWRQKGEEALNEARLVAMLLDPIVLELQAALKVPDFPERAQLEGLIDSAHRNRAALTDQARALVQQALDSVAGHGDAKAAAVAAVEATAQKLEAMRDRSAGDRPFRELQPMIAELRDVWTALDRALAPLGRADERAVRGAQQERMGAAAKALCSNLYRAKARDRASGAWPMPMIDAPGESAAERFAAALARVDFAGAHALLAPWVRTEWSEARLREEFERSAAEIAAGFDLDAPPAPGAFYAGQNPMRYEDVREGRNVGGARIPTEVTRENFIAWYPIEIRTEEEDEYLTDIGCLANLFAIGVKTPEGDRIGYLAFSE